MDFSLQLLPEQPLAQLIDVVRLADGLGFRACYSAERLRSPASPRSGSNACGATLRRTATTTWRSGWSTLA